MLAANTGRHSDKPVLEPDATHLPVTGRHHERGRPSADATAAETQPLDPADTVELEARHRRRSRFLAWLPLSAAVAVLALGAYVAIPTQMGTRPPNQGVPVPESPLSVTPSKGHPLDGPEPVPERSDPLPGSRLRAPAVRPSGAGSVAPTPTLRIVAPSPDASTSPHVSRETTPKAVPSSSPVTVPTVTQTVRATETAGRPHPRVSVTIWLPVPVPTG